MLHRVTAFCFPALRFFELARVLVRLNPLLRINIVPEVTLLGGAV